MQFEQCIIRLLTTENLDPYFILINNNRKWPEHFFQGTIAISKTLEETKMHLEDIISKSKKINYFPFVVIDTISNKMVSICSGKKH